MRIGKLNVAGKRHWAKLFDERTAMLLPPEFSLGNWEAFLGWQGPSIDYQTAELLAPVCRHAKIICIGKNYADHAAEMGGAAPELPIIFSKFNSAFNDPFANVILPPISHQVDFEAELVVMMGQRCKNINESEAQGAVLGYLCGNDVSARDWQKGRPGGQWLVGKSFDGFAPIGPWITTADDIPDVTALEVRMELNGQTMQLGNTRDLIYPVEYLIAYLSKFFTLEPGDVIFTGTPAGVGAGRIPPLFLQAGDVAEVTVTGLGSIRNCFVSS